MTITRIIVDNSKLGLFCGLILKLYYKNAQIIRQAFDCKEAAHLVASVGLDDINIAIAEAEEFFHQLNQSYSNKSSPKNLSKIFLNDKLRLVVMQRLVKEFAWQLNFFSAVKIKFKGEGTILILPVGSEISNHLSRYGYHLHKKLCRVLYLAELIKRVLKSTRILVKNEILGLIKDYYILRKNHATRISPANTFWFELPISMFSDNPKGINVPNYLLHRSGVIDPTITSHFVSTSVTSGRATNNNVSVEVGDDYLRCSGRLPIKLSELIYGISESFINWFCSLNVLINKNYRWLAPISEEVVMLARHKLWFKSVKPKYIMSFQNLSGKPLWMLLANKYSAIIGMVFYSRNCEPLRTAKSIESNLPLYNYLADDFFVVWNENHKHWLMARGIHEGKIRNSGPIIFSSLINDLEEHVKNTRLCNKSVNRIYQIGIFDRPLTEVRYLVRSDYWAPYYRTSTARLFYSDILEVCSDLFGDDGFIFNYKTSRKRAGDDPLYWEMIREVVESHKRTRAINPEVSPAWASAEQDMVISIPFTSVSDVAAALGVNSCYYDPSSLLVNGKLGEGAELVCGKAALKQWIQDSLKELNN